MSQQELLKTSTAGQHAGLVENQLLNVLEIKRLTRGVLDLVASSPCDHAALVACFKDIEARVQDVQQKWPEVDKLMAAVEAAAATAGSQTNSQDWRMAAVQASQAIQLLQAEYCSRCQMPCAVPLSQRPHCTPAVLAPDVLQGVLQRVRQLLPPPLSLGVVRTLNPYAKGPSEVHLSCPGVFVAAVALAAPGSPEPVHVCVDAPPAAGQQPSPWAIPQQQVYKRVSSLAASALSYYLQQAAAGAAVVSPSSRAPAAGGEGTTGAAAAAAAATTMTPPPDPVRHTSPAGGAQGAPGAVAAGWALECLLYWLAGYADLFSRPCHVSGKVVCWEPASLMPLVPVVRPFKLTLAQLQAAATDPSQRLAYHAHLAPKHVLQLEAPAVSQRVLPGTTSDTGDMGHSVSAGLWQEEQLRACLAAAGLLPSEPSDGSMAARGASPQQGVAGRVLPQEDMLWEVVDRVAVVVPPPAAPPPAPAHPAPAAAAAANEAAAGAGGGGGGMAGDGPMANTADAAAGNQGTPAAGEVPLAAPAGAADRVDTPAGMSPDEFNLLEGTAPMGSGGMLGLSAAVSPPDQQQQYVGSTFQQQQQQQLHYMMPQQQEDLLADSTAAGSSELTLAAGVTQTPQQMLPPEEQQQQAAAINAHQSAQHVQYQYQQQPPG